MDIDPRPAPVRHEPVRRAGRRRPVLASLASLGAAILALGAVALGTAIEHAANPPTCYGIGWGCTPDPGTTALLLGWFVAAPAVLVAWSLTWLGWAVTRLQTDRVRLVATWWPAWTLTLVAVVVGILAVTTAG